MARAMQRPVVLLSGASGTLGTAVIRRLAADYDIAAVRWRHPLADGSDREEYVDPLDPERSPATPLPFEIISNLMEPGEITRVVELALAKFGRIDALVNAVGLPRRGSLIRSRTLEFAGRAFQLNALLPVQLAGAVSDAFWRFDEAGNAAANRSVVNVSALASIDTDAGADEGVTAASKAALNMLTVHLARDIEHLKVRANAVAPAAFPGRVATERVADAVADLLSGKENGRILAMWSDSDELI
jgi:NAD(P)-dependent dehydrogenase (short-subunit alcohol dehydrogenase family)